MPDPSLNPMLPYWYTGVQKLLNRLADALARRDYTEVMHCFDGDPDLVVYTPNDKFTGGRSGVQKLAFYD